MMPALEKLRDTLIQPSEIYLKEQGLFKTALTQSLKLGRRPAFCTWIAMVLGFYMVFISSNALASAGVIVMADFDLGTEGFEYMDDIFRGTNAPVYASGALNDAGGNPGGALQITLGGIDNADIFGMSGGWQQSFQLAEACSVTLSFDYRLEQASDYESDENSQVLVSIDGILSGTSGTDFIAQLTGNGNGGPAMTTSWQRADLNVGPLGAGQHTLVMGGYNNKKTLNDESTQIFVDNVSITGEIVSETVILDVNFDTGAEDFLYRDDPFRATNNSSYATGFHNTSGGFTGGGLRVTLGGLDNVDVFGMSGGWGRTFTVPEVRNAKLSFRYNLVQTSDYESDEFSQVLVSIDGMLVSPTMNDFITQATGNGNGGNPQETGWTVVEIDLGLLAVGNHTLVIGGFNNKKTFNNESTEVLIDDILIKLVSGNTSPSGAQEAVARLDFQRFKDNIESLAGFGDRSQGSSSYDQAANWLQLQLEAVGYSVEFHNYTFQGQPRSNMYVTKVGTTFPDRMYMVSAHLDGRGGGGGADDDGSGSSLVLESARILADVQFESETSIRFIFWNNEETGLNGSSAYVSNRAGLQGLENPPGSRMFPEPTWLGIIQHDMILFDHGLPPQANQVPGADIDVEYRSTSSFASQALALANSLLGGNISFSTDYPAEIGPNMSNTDSVPFQNFTAAVSVRENQRLAEIGNGANPHWHQPTDVFSTYSEDDFRLGFNALKMTLGTISELAGVRLLPPEN